MIPMETSGASTIFGSSADLQTMDLDQRKRHRPERQRPTRSCLTHWELPRPETCQKAVRKPRAGPIIASMWLLGDRASILTTLQAPSTTFGSPTLLQTMGLDEWKQYGQEQWRPTRSLRHVGTPAAGNISGGRYGASSWTDSSGNFWLLGGVGYDANDTAWQTPRPSKSILPRIDGPGWAGTSQWAPQAPTAECSARWGRLLRKTSGMAVSSLELDSGNGILALRRTRLHGHWLL